MAAKQAYMQPYIHWQYEQYSTKMLITSLKTCLKILYTHNHQAHPLRQYLTLKFNMMVDLQCMVYWFILS